MTRRDLPAVALATALAATLAVAAPAAAQVDLFQECRGDRVGELAEGLEAPWAELHPGAVYGRAMAALAASGAWAPAADELSASFRTMAALADLPPGTLGPMLDGLRAARDDLDGWGGDPAGLPNAGRFRVFVAPRQGDRPGRVELTQLGGDPLVLGDTAPLPAVRAVCWTAIAGQRVLTAANAEARDATLRGLRRAVAAWDSFNETGYAQYPWELALNRPEGGLMPPRWQFILLHPGVGLELAGIEDLDTARRADVVLVEPFGVLRYNDGRTFYLGASLVTSIADSESPGFGAMIHAGPYVKAGYVFRNEPEGEPNRDGILLTADLLQLIQGAPEVYRQFRDGLVSQLLDRALQVR